MFIITTDTDTDTTTDTTTDTDTDTTTEICEKNLYLFSAINKEISKSLSSYVTKSEKELEEQIHNLRKELIYIDKSCKNYTNKNIINIVKSNIHKSILKLEYFKSLKIEYN
jgi:ribosomal protein L29